MVFREICRLWYPAAVVRRTKKIREAGDWYDSNLDLHLSACQKIPNLLRELLGNLQIPVERIDSRVKTKESFLDKASKRNKNRPRYKNPQVDIKDVVGIRAVTLIEPTVDDICELIRKEFSVDEDHSLDKSKELGTDRVGYRSQHLIARFSDHRLELPEYRDFAEITFEIQIRSLLQHVWSEVEHDRRFKFPGELPAEYKRRFSLAAAQIEAVDRELSNLVRDIDAHLDDMANLASGVSAVNKRLTIDDLRSYLRGTLSRWIETDKLDPSLYSDGSGMVEELARFGVVTLGELAELLSNEFTLANETIIDSSADFVDVLRSAMIVIDSKKYFAIAWNNRWHEINDSLAQALSAQVEELDQMLHQLSIVRLLEPGDVDAAACQMCGRLVSEQSLAPFGAGGSEAPMWCRICWNEVEQEAAAEREADQKKE